MARLSYIDIAKRVVQSESHALSVLKDAIDQNFADAVDLMLNAKGRIIVLGMGKSGHIARKIAATFASTGTPSQFVHPAEASHGDLGMLTRDDVALVLSNSGETAELANVIAHTKRFQIPLIGVASNPKSNLLVQSDISLVLPKVKEACTTGVVPTSSTTMALCLGDALAIAMMEYRDFTADHFKEFHPGGLLGAHLTKVKDLMHAGKAVPLVTYDAPIGDTLQTISAKGFGIVGVVDKDDYLIGVITDGDLRRNLDGLMNLSVTDIMTKNPLTVNPDALAEHAVAIMNDTEITCLFVTEKDGQNVSGVINIHDCLRAGIG